MIARLWDFKGRAGRLEFIAYMIVMSVIATIYHSPILAIPSTVKGVLTLICLVPQTAAAARRLHDVGLSGWWQLSFYAVMLYPLLGLNLEGPGGLMSVEFALAVMVLIYGCLLLLACVLICIWPGNRRGDRFGPGPIDTRIFDAGTA